MTHANAGRIRPFSRPQSKVGTARIDHLPSTPRVLTNRIPERAHPQGRCERGFGTLTVRQKMPLRYLGDGVRYAGGPPQHSHGEHTGLTIRLLQDPFFNLLAETISAGAGRSFEATRRTPWHLRRPCTCQLSAFSPPARRCRNRTTSTMRNHVQCSVLNRSRNTHFLPLPQRCGI